MFKFEKGEEKEQIMETENDNPTITVLGVDLDEENFPELYQWAKNNPATLEKKLKDLANVWHSYPIKYAAGALEESLEADRNHKRIYLPLD